MNAFLLKVPILCLLSVLLCQRVVAQNNEENLLSRKRLKYFYFDKDMIATQTSFANEGYEELNSIHKYAKGDFMIFSDNTFHLNAHLDYVYLVSESFIDSLNDIKPLSALFKDLHRYKQHIANGNYAIITKGRSGKYNVYIDYGPACMAEILGFSAEKQDKFNTNRRFKHAYKQKPKINKSFLTSNIRPLSDLEKASDQPKEGIYYKDLDGIYDHYIGEYNYQDSIHRVEIKITKGVKKRYLESDNQKAYFVDKLNFSIQHWKGNALVFDSSTPSEKYGVVQTIINENHREYFMDFLVYLERANPIYKQPLLKFSIQKRKEEYYFHAQYSYARNTYRQNTIDGIYDFPQYVILQKRTL